MAYNTVAIKKDVDNKPIPQYYNPLVDAYEVLQGRNGASRVELYNSAGNAIDIEALLNAISALLTAIKDTAGIKKITDPLPAGTNNIGKVDIASALPAGANTIGGVKIVGNDTLFQGNLTLTGTAQQLPSQASKVVTIQAEPTNRGYVYIGLSNVNAENHMSTLTPGSSMTFYVSNLNLLYVYGTAGDKICWGGEV